MNELSKLGLLERVRAEFGRANYLYIKIPKDVETVTKPPAIESENRQSVGRKSASKKASYPSANNYNKSHVTIQLIVSREVFSAFRLKIPRHANKNPIANGDF